MVLHLQYNAAGGRLQPQFVTTFASPVTIRRCELSPEDQALKTDSLIFALLTSAIHEHDVEWLLSAGPEAFDHLGLPYCPMLWAWIERGFPSAEQLLKDLPADREQWLKIGHPKIETLIEGHIRAGLYRPDNYIKTQPGGWRKLRRHGGADSPSSHDSNANKTPAILDPVDPAIAKMQAEKWVKIVMGEGKG